MNKCILIMTFFTSLFTTIPGWADCSSPSNITVTRPDSIYRDNFDGTVSDKSTGLTWAKCSVGQAWVDNASNDGADDQCSGVASPFTWKTALEAAKSANDSDYLGHTTWRLPNVKELESLTDKACISPAINHSVFPSTATDAPYITSSPHAGSHAGTVWYVYFGDGGVGKYTKQDSFRVRLVRSEL